MFPYSRSAAIRNEHWTKARSIAISSVFSFQPLKKFMKLRDANHAASHFIAAGPFVMGIKCPGIEFVGPSPIISSVSWEFTAGTIAAINSIGGLAESGNGGLINLDRRSSNSNTPRFVLRSRLFHPFQFSLFYLRHSVLGCSFVSGACERELPRKVIYLIVNILGWVTNTGADKI